MDWTPLRGLYYDIIGNQKLKLIYHVCPLLWLALPWYQLPGDDGDLWMRRNHSSLALCLASGAVLLIPVKVTGAAPGLFILLADPPGVNSSIPHSHFWFAKGKWPALWAKRQDQYRVQEMSTAWHNEMITLHLNSEKAQGVSECKRVLR